MSKDTVLLHAAENIAKNYAKLTSSPMYPYNPEIVEHLRKYPGQIWAYIPHSSGEVVSKRKVKRFNMGWSRKAMK